MVSKEGTAYYLEKRQGNSFEREGKIWRDGKEYDFLARERIKERENGYEKEVIIEGDVNVELFVKFEEEKVDRNKAHFQGAELYFNQKHSFEISGDAWVLSFYDAWPFEYKEDKYEIVCYHAGKVGKEEQIWQKIFEFDNKKYFVKERGLLVHKKGFWYEKEVFLL